MIINDQQKTYKRCLGDFSRYLKEYSTHAKEILAGQSAISEEYYRAENNLQDKKFKKMMLDKGLWDLDEELMKKNGLEKDQAYSNPEIARRFMFSDVD